MLPPEPNFFLFLPSLLPSSSFLHPSFFARFFTPPPLLFKNHFGFLSSFRAFVSLLELTVLLLVLKSEYCFFYCFCFAASYAHAARAFSQNFCGCGFAPLSSCYALESTKLDATPLQHGSMTKNDCPINYSFRTAQFRLFWGLCYATRATQLANIHHPFFQPLPSPSGHNPAQSSLPPQQTIETLFLIPS